ncbi:ubiquitin-like domain-containing protein [Streptomyces sp. NPDC015127]|uniref:ubiquitin-like domain-containing protein n=1 Tax=Streptomyces sp. NPDC015127 TaxID=3364939 RepID=UPI0036F67F84
MSNAQGSHRAARGGRRQAPSAPVSAASPTGVRTAPGEAGPPVGTTGQAGWPSAGYGAPQPTVVDARLATAYAPTMPYVDLRGTGLPAPSAPVDGETGAGGPQLPRQMPAAYQDAPGGTGSPGTGSPGTGGRARGRRRRAAERPDTLRRLVPQALVVAFLAGGTSAFVAADKSVRLTVDGAPRTLHTFADDVQEFLLDEGFAVGPHDSVAPGPRAELVHGDEVVVRYGRPLALTLDGHRRTVWTTARTVEEALRELGVRAEGAFVSVPRSSVVPRSGLALDVRTERSVTFMADGRERTIRTNAATVREALAEAGIALRGQDTTSVPPESFPRDGQTVTVMRITGTRKVREEPVPYTIERTRDPQLFAGTEVVVRQGAPGVRRVTYALRTVNGVRQKPRKLSEEIVREPVTEQVRVGMRQLPSSVGGADNLDWDALAHCESGGRPGAVDPSGNYGGLYQFDTGTWRALGGSGRPQDAPPAEQTYRAKKLYVQRGATPWPHCGRRLYR